MVFEAVAGLASKSGPEHFQDLQDPLALFRATAPPEESAVFTCPAEFLRILHSKVFTALYLYYDVMIVVHNSSISDCFKYRWTPKIAAFFHVLRPIKGQID